MLLSAMAFACITLAPSHSRASPPPTYSIDFHTISAGGNALRDSCYRLSGTVGQVAPGYSSGSIYSLIAGYWRPATTSATEELFFDGFERC
jgi:hypothetical protein